MARIVLKHPDLDGTIERDERSLPVWEATGWRRVGSDAADDDKPAETAESPTRARRRSATES